MADFSWKNDCCPTPGLLEHFPPPRQMPAARYDAELKQWFMWRGSLHFLNKNTLRRVSHLCQWKHVRYPMTSRLLCLAMEFGPLFPVMLYKLFSKTSLQLVPCFINCNSPAGAIQYRCMETWGEHVGKQTTVRYSWLQNAARVSFFLILHSGGVRSVRIYRRILTGCKKWQLGLSVRTLIKLEAAVISPFHKPNLQGN